MGVEDGADALHAAVEIGLQFLGQLFARRFVRRVTLVAVRQPGIVDPAEVVGAMRLEEPLQKVDAAPGGRRVLTAARRKRARDEGEERAIDERVAVHEEEARRGWRGGGGRDHGDARWRSVKWWRRSMN